MGYNSRKLVTGSCMYLLLVIMSWVLALVLSTQRRCSLARMLKLSHGVSRPAMTIRFQIISSTLAGLCPYELSTLGARPLSFGGSVVTFLRHSTRLVWDPLAPWRLSAVVVSGYFSWAAVQYLRSLAQLALSRGSLLQQKKRGSS